MIEGYMMYCEREPGKSINESQMLMGRGKIPYQMYLENGVFKLYGAKEITADEAQKIASVDLSYTEDYLGAQVILCDDNRLCVNFADYDEYDYNLYTRIYKLSADGTKWELMTCRRGFYFVDVHDSHSWPFLDEKME